MSFIGMLIIGLVAGALARLLVPGKDPMGIIGTLVLGLVGSFIAGLVVRAVSDNDGVSLIGSVVGAVVALLVYRAVAGRSNSPTAA